MKRPRWLPDTCPSTFPPPLFPFFSTWPPGNSHGYVSPRRDTTRHDTTAEALKPANLFLLSFHATRPPHSRTPLHSARSAPLDNVADKVARNVVAGNFFSPFPWRTNKTVRVVARVKRHEIRWPSFFTNHLLPPSRIYTLFIAIFNDIYMYGYVSIIRLKKKMA